jgi:hypothetical protein
LLKGFEDAPANDDKKGEEEKTAPTNPAVEASEGKTGKVTIDASEWNATQAQLKALTEKSEKKRSPKLLLDIHLMRMAENFLKLLSPQLLNLCKNFLPL